MMSTGERIERIFRDVLSIDVPSVSTDIIAAGLLDSLALVTLLFEVEQEFGVMIPLEDLNLETLRTVERIAALVEGVAGEPDSPAPASTGSPR
jgi:D-alanine--poly(phosphoribitol) ligase subunit 2